MAHKIQLLMLALLSFNTIAQAAPEQPSTSGVIIKKGKMVYSEIVIHAPKERVWQVFTDFVAYPNWNPFIRSLEGSPKVGGHIKVLLQPAGSKGMLFKPRVLKFETNSELRWIGKLGVPYIFDGEHTFQLIDNGDGTTTFRQYELSGVS